MMVGMQRGVMIRAEVVVVVRDGMEQEEGGIAMEVVADKRMRLSVFFRGLLV